MPSQTGSLAVTGDPDADRLLNTDPLALLVGMLLDQILAQFTKLVTYVE